MNKILLLFLIFSMSSLSYSIKPVDFPACRYDAKNPCKEKDVNHKKYLDAFSKEAWTIPQNKEKTFEAKINLCRYEWSIAKENIFLRTPDCMGYGIYKKLLDVDKNKKGKEKDAACDKLCNFISYYSGRDDLDGHCHCMDR